ncbi:hypothetical protein JMN12_09675 [Capnocytophaga genosp. AHN8471]|jgi:hypothetical protein|uniref:hypothetical protein n=1 Tax=Capnocytophaga genosp. AHN8471 TaxID=327574 RepID=UPI0019339396|nr:hypothetical protein [Capnocytophaga genosp. AHN8471]MBM0656809.1 hypothetical protein [Capnocytophaga genosp. AHN8471]
MNIKAWIQSSNENEDDFVLENGKLLPIEDKIKGREFVNLMFDIKENGKVKHQEPFLEIVQSKKDKNLFLIDMSAENKDIHQRRVAVMLLVEGYEETESSEFKRLIEETFKSTTPQTQVSEETIEKMIQTIEGAKKNLEKSFFSNPIVIGAIIVGIILLILALSKL